MFFILCKSMSPGEVLRRFITEYLIENQLGGFLEKEIPKKWEKYGDFVLFDERTFCNEIWKEQGHDFWEKTASLLKCKRIGLKNKIKNDGFRTPNVTILLGDDPWILHRENSIVYTWNVEKSMFSAGNACEKLRIAKINCEGEVVVDLFAGIGYFTLPFLLHSKAAHVHACEWNPAAVEALNRNLALNKVSDKCTVHEGDSRFVCPRKIANRVNLGLIPSCETHWETACEALAEGGGLLHIHENVETKKNEFFCSHCSGLEVQVNPDLCQRNISINSKEKIVREGSIEICWKHKQWLLKGMHILHSLIAILSERENSKVWYCAVENVNFVKSYAPHVSHLVYDVRIQSEVPEKQ